ncbi:Flp pilus assembly complex ATPase component TadA [Candidatus Marsarchaeota archaeon]|jgi:flagellar protein FlaI|nr:Flp pilus assembly complex ATPase component TadA [Candidatus Marsarchaeota archaeon]MCL5090019.1 Flp pilus assembly complex ATPase component TadA [Candidatus Marsarchaeota archaeon]
MMDMEEGKLREIESRILKRLKGKFVNIKNEKKQKDIIGGIAKAFLPDISSDEIDLILKNILDLSPINDLLTSETIEDIMINNTNSVFIYDSRDGFKKLDFKIESNEDLEFLVDKFKLFTTNETSNGNILDIQLPSKSRANVISSPEGYNVTIRNFKPNPLSIIDLINSGELDYQVAARLWIYIDGFGVRPANILISGMPAAGKTTMLNSLFSFFRPEERVISIEETYELDIKTQQNCVRLQTSLDMPMVDLVKNSLRMRSDKLIIGEVRGPEANDMITAMNIGKNVFGTIHGSSSRDVINRLQNSPMNVPKDIIPVLDVILTIGRVYENKNVKRKVVQISEISGIESQILLSDIYKFDYKTHKALEITQSVTYRDNISQILGISPVSFINEENIRANMLYNMNKKGIRSIEGISNIVKEYYKDQESTLKKLGLNVKPAIEI